MVSAPKAKDASVLKAAVNGLLRDIEDCRTLLRGKEQGEYSRKLLHQKEEDLAQKKSEVDLVETLITRKEKRRRRFCSNDGEVPEMCGEPNEKGSYPSSAFDLEVI
jgi:hypothetical protein